MFQLRELKRLLFQNFFLITKLSAFGTIKLKNFVFLIHTTLFITKTTLQMFTYTMFLLLAKITVNIKMGDSCFRIVYPIYRVSHYFPFPQSYHTRFDTCCCGNLKYFLTLFGISSFTLPSNGFWG